MAKIIALFFFALILLSGIYIRSGISEETSVSLQSTPTPSIPELIHPYSISKLNTHVNSDNKIQIERVLPRSRSSYDSFVVSYDSEGFKQYALMHVPTGTPPVSGWPVVIVNHGYIPPESYSTIESYKNTSAYFASSGFLILKPDYRGHDNSEGDISLPISRSQYAVDVLNLIEAVDALENADPDKIFLYGHSMGGEVSLQVAQASSKVKGVTLWAPAITSYPQSVIYFLSRRRPTPTALPTLVSDISRIISQFGSTQLSSFSNLSLVNVPILIHHGTADESVPYSWGQDLADKLKNEEKLVTFHTYPQDNHDIAGHWSQALSRDIGFFKSLL